jgi:hypothetical protein
MELRSKLLALALTTAVFILALSLNPSGLTVFAGL